MENLGKTIGNNLIHLRKKAGLTQLEFGEKFSYSDKTVSKWEQGDIIPSVENLKSIADYYGVSVDFILNEHRNEEDFKKIVKGTPNYRNKIVIILMFIMVIFSIATVVYVASIFDFKTANPNENRYWSAYFWAIPASFLLLTLYTMRIFKSKKWTIIYLSLAVWTILLAAYVTFLYKGNYWFLFFIGLPVQIIFILMFYLKQ